MKYSEALSFEFMSKNKVIKFVPSENSIIVIWYLLKIACCNMLSSGNNIVLICYLQKKKVLL